MAVTITVCMGSSCFARGNARHLELIEAWLRDRRLEAQIELRGSRCEGRCRQGPVIAFDAQVYTGVDEGMLRDLLARQEAEHG